jgi:putative ABC transport system permease protein
MTRAFDTVRHALRTLARSPFFTLVAVLTLALGIGATTTIYSAVDAVLVRALPYPQGERLVALWVDGEKRGFVRQEFTNPADFGDWQAQLTTVESMAAWSAWTPTLTGDGEPAQLLGAQVSRRYFEVLGVAPLLGRGFTGEEDQPNGPAVAVVSHAFWRDVLGAPSELGQRIDLNGTPHSVVGVMPPGFAAPLLANRQVWRPLQADLSTGRGGFFLRVFARLKPGVDVAAAQAEFAALQRRLAAQHPDSNYDLGAYVQPLHELLGENLRQQLLVLLAATALVLAIACANLANLLLARASHRSREFALRASLGASRGRIARQLLTESCLLGIAGALAGLAFAVLAVRAVGRLLPPEVTQIAPLAVDLRVAGFAALLALACGLLFGAAPALASARDDLAGRLRDSERGSSSRAAQRLRAGLVVGTFAFALSLCVGAGLFLKSLNALQHTDPGFATAQVLSFRIMLPAARYEDAAALRPAYQRLVERLRAIPGVTAAGLGSTLPLAENNTDTRVYFEGALSLEEGQRLWFSQVDPGFLAALQVPIVAGRNLADSDHADGVRVAVVNRAFVDSYLPGRDPLGVRVAIGSIEEPDWLEIVGVAGDVRFFGLDQAQTPSAYLPLAQFASRGLFVALGSHGDAAALLPQVRQALAEVDPQLALGQPMTMQARVEQALTTPRLIAALTAGFATLALLLAALGVYGVVAYTVATRTREFGVRLALGSTARRLLQLVLAGGLRLALAGVAVGTLLALALGRLLGGLLYEVEPFDPWVLLTVAALLAAVALLASLLPALRTLRIAPNTALRYE